MKDILEALSAAAPNVERKLYTILTGNDIGKKINDRKWEIVQTDWRDRFVFHISERTGKSTG